MGDGDDHVLSVGDDGAISISIVDVAVSAVPVLGVTGLVAGSSLSLGVLSTVLAGSSQFNSHHVGVQVAVLIQPSGTAIGAVPVLDVTQLGAGGLLSLNVDHVVGDGDDNVLSVGHDGASSVSVVHIAVSAVPVLNVTGLEAGSSLSLDVLSAVRAGSGQLNRQQVGVQGALSIQPSHAANIAVPVLDVTLGGAGSGNSLNVDDVVRNLTLLAANVADSGAIVKVGVTGSGHDNHEAVQRHAGGILVIPAAAASIAVPVLDVTVRGAGSVLSLNVVHGVSSLGVGHLVADHANGIASVEVLVSSLGAGLLAALGAGLGALVLVLVLASGLVSNAINGDGDVLGSHGNSDVAVGNEVRTLQVDNAQIVVAGLGTLLHAEGSGEVERLLTDLRGGGGTSGVQHDALLSVAGLLVNGAQVDVLVGRGVVLATHLNHGQPHLLVLIEIGDQLESIVVKTQLDAGTDQTGGLIQVLQVNFNLELVADGDFLGLVHDGEHDGGLVSSGYGSEGDHSAQHQSRQKNCQNLFHFAYTFLINVRI